MKNEEYTLSSIIQDALDAYGLSEQMPPDATTWQLVLQHISEAHHKELAQLKTENYENAQHAQKNLAFLEAILSNASDGVVVTNAHGAIEQSNLVFDHMFSLNPDASFNQPLTRFFVENDQASIQAGVSICGQGTERHLRLEAQAIRPDGSTFYADVMLGTIMQQDRTRAGIVVSIRDITATKELEMRLEQSRDEALAVSRLKSQFLATMGHELRTPLNAVIGFSEILMTSNLEAEQRDSIKTIHESGLDLLHIVDQILLFSQIEAGKLTLDIQFVPLKQFFKDLLPGYEKQATAKSLSFEHHLDVQYDYVIKTDPRLLQNILDTIFSNAIKFTAVGTIDFNCAITSHDDDIVQCKFSIIDTGIGISEDVHESILEPFRQSDASYTRRYEGIGLGLAIANRLIKLMSGQLDFFDNPSGQGTVFEISLPFALYNILDDASTNQ